MKRREFLKRAGGVAVALPVLTLLPSALADDVEAPECEGPDPRELFNKMREEDEVLQKYIKTTQGGTYWGEDCGVNPCIEQPLDGDMYVFIDRSPGEVRLKVYDGDEWRAIA